MANASTKSHEGIREWPLFNNSLIFIRGDDWRSNSTKEENRSEEEQLTYHSNGEKPFKVLRGNSKGD